MLERFVEGRPAECAARLEALQVVLRHAQPGRPQDVLHELGGHVPRLFRVILQEAGACALLAVGREAGQHLRRDE